MAIFGPKKGGPDPPEFPPGPGAPPGSLGKRDSRRRQNVLLVIELLSLVCTSLAPFFLFLRKQKKLYDVRPPYGGASGILPKMGKNPIFRAPCDRLSHGPQNWDFFPIADPRKKFPRKMEPGMAQ